MAFSQITKAVIQLGNMPSAFIVLGLVIVSLSAVWLPVLSGGWKVKTEFFTQIRKVFQRCVQTAVLKIQNAPARILDLDCFIHSPGCKGEPARARAIRNFPHSQQVSECLFFWLFVFSRFIHI